MDDNQVQAMLDRLRIEVICNSDDSIHICGKALHNYGPINEEPQENIESANACSESEQQHRKALSLSVPAAAALSEVSRALELRTPNTKLVESVEEFYEHTQKHRARVKALGLELFRSHPQLFEGLSESQVERVLEAHDQAKVRATVKAPNGRPFYQVLYNEGFGKKLDRNIVDALNANDKQIMEVAEEVNGIHKSAELQAKMERIEKIADLVDRGMSPVSAEEFGRSMDKASEFLKSPEDRALAIELEKKYLTVTKDLQYKSLSPLRVSFLANHLYIQEHFSNALAKYGPKVLSVKSLAHAALSGGKKLGVSVMKALSSMGILKALSLADGPLLYFSGMSNTGCSENGHHDWIMNPNCQPVIGLTPKVIEFLGADWEQQKMFLQHEQHTCEVIKKTYEQSIEAPKVTKCETDQVEFKTKNGDHIVARFDNQYRIRDVELGKGNILNRFDAFGERQTVAYNGDGQIQEVCEASNASLYAFGKKCMSLDSPYAQNPAAFVRSLNYQMQKAIQCCRNSNSFAETKCP